MKFPLLATASALSLLVSAPAIAQLNAGAAVGAGADPVTAAPTVPGGQSLDTTAAAAAATNPVTKPAGNMPATTEAGGAKHKHKGHGHDAATGTTAGTGANAGMSTGTAGTNASMGTTTGANTQAGSAGTGASVDTTTTTTGNMGTPAKPEGR